MKLIFKLRDGSTVTQTANENLILNEAMFQMLAHNVNQNIGSKIPRNKTKGLKLSDLKSVEIIF